VGRSDVKGVRRVGGEGQEHCEHVERDNRLTANHRAGNRLTA
jgi:hypothetical protein